MTANILTIASWNIRKAVGLDWRRDPERILQVLRAMQADIVLLQEADKRLPPRPPALPGDMVADYGWTALDADPATPSTGYHGNAILLRPDLQASQITGVDLPGLEPRGAILARIDGAFGALTIGGVHLGLRGSDRPKQIRQVAQAAQKLGGPVLLGGDFNEWRKSGSNGGLPKGWQMVIPGPTFHAAKPVLALDRFLAGPGVTVHAADVPDKSECLRASDHLPIRTVIEV